MANKNTSLNVGIVGAGIAGLSAAIGLSHAGHVVEVFEKSRFANEVGAAIHVCPNATRILQNWGFDFVKSRAVLVAHGRVISGKTLQPFYEGTYDNYADRFGAPWYFLHRVDLHSGLKDLAMEAGVAIRLASEVTSMDCETGTITLANGNTVTKDLIIAADGVHSKAPTLVDEEAIPTAGKGSSAFRFIIPTQKLVDAGLSQSLNIGPVFGMTVAPENNRWLVWYPCRGGEFLNFCGIHPDRNEENTQGANEWSLATSQASLLDEFQTFHPDLVKACTMAEDLKLFKFAYHPPINHWYKGKLALAGDSVHPMLPFQGQGGAQAIEDGAALGILFASLSSAEDISARLQLYETIRKKRAAALQILSNAGQEDVGLITEEVQKYIDGPVPKNHEELHEHNFGYDVVAVCETAMA